MSRRTDEEMLTRWLAAERADQEDEAETALSAVLASLPRPAPASGFAGRVLTRLTAGGETAEAFGDRLFGRRGVRLALAAAFALMGASLIVFPPLVAGLASALRLASLLTLGVELLAALGRWVGAGMQLWGVLSGLSQTLAAVVATPVGAAVLGAVILISISALRLLAELLAQERSVPHVD